MYNKDAKIKDEFHMEVRGGGGGGGVKSRSDTRTEGR